MDNLQNPSQETKGTGQFQNNFIFALTPKVETLHVALAQIKIGDPEFRLFFILEELN
jgi:hypothetical protein